MGIKHHFSVVQGSPYQFSHLACDKDGIAIVFNRRVGYMDDVSEDQAPARSVLSVKALHDFYTGDISHRVPDSIKIGNKRHSLYPRSELRKAITQVAHLPRDVLGSDIYVQNYFKNTQKWPHTKWDHVNTPPNPLRLQLVV